MEFTVKFDKLSIYQKLCDDFEKKKELDYRDAGFLCRMIEVCKDKPILKKKEDEIEDELEKPVPTRKADPTKKRGRPTKTNGEKSQKKTKKQTLPVEKKPKKSVVEQEDVYSDEKENPTKDVYEYDEQPTKHQHPVHTNEQADVDGESSDEECSSLLGFSSEEDSS